MGDPKGQHSGQGRLTADYSSCLQLAGRHPKRQPQIMVPNPFRTVALLLCPVRIARGFILDSSGAARFRELPSRSAAPTHAASRQLVCAFRHHLQATRALPAYVVPEVNFAFGCTGCNDPAVTRHATAGECPKIACALRDDRECIPRFFWVGLAKPDRAVFAGRHNLDGPTER